jgi:hypothetical protein
MAKAYSARTSMAVHALKKEKGSFRPKEGEVLRQKYTYLCVIGALMYPTNHTRPDIAFTMNYLVRQHGCNTPKKQ